MSGFACLGTKVEAAIVAATLLPKMMQDAHFHMDKAFVTTALSLPNSPHLFS